MLIVAFRSDETCLQPDHIKIPPILKVRPETTSGIASFQPFLNPATICDRHDLRWVIARGSNVPMTSVAELRLHMQLVDDEDPRIILVTADASVNLHPSSSENH